MHVLKVATLPSSNAATIDMTMKPTTSRTVGARILLNVLSSRCMVMMNLRRELDKVKNAIKGKIALNLDGMLKRINSPFTTQCFGMPLAS